MSVGLIATIVGQVKTLLDRLTSTRAGYLDLLDDIEADTSALESRLTATRASYIDAPISGISGGGFTVQRGTATIPQGHTSATATISSVNMSKSFLRFSYKITAIDPEVDARGVWLDGYINTSTQVKFDVGVSECAFSIHWEVITSN
jgi:hypothetical protein